MITPYSGERDISALEGSEHRVYRALVSGPFKKDAVERLTQNVIGPLINELVDALPTGETVDLVPALCKPLPLGVIQRMLGVPPDPRLDHWADAFINTHQDPKGRSRPWSTSPSCCRASSPSDASNRVTISVARRARRRRRRAAQRRRRLHVRRAPCSRPAPTPPTCRAATCSRSCSSEPARWEQCVEEPDVRPRVGRGVPPAREPAGVDAACRAARRRVPRHQIAAGSFSLLCLAAANHEPGVYERPDEFLPDRWLPGSETAPLLTFGYSAHFCLGAPTARRRCGRCSTCSPSGGRSWRSPAAGDARHDDAARRSRRGAGGALATGCRDRRMMRQR